jgi:hypothetical protein
LSLIEPDTPKKGSIEDLMNPDKVPTSNVQILNAERDELFRQFENHPGKLSLATEIKIIDDQIAEEIAEEARGKEKAGTAQTKE